MSFRNDTVSVANPAFLGGKKMIVGFTYLLLCNTQRGLVRNIYGAYTPFPYIDADITVLMLVLMKNKLSKQS